MTGILFDTLKDEMTLEVVTHNSSYVIRRASFVTWIAGGTRKDGSARYHYWNSIKIIGSSYPNTTTRIGYIGKQMLLSFYDYSRERIITTSAIRSIALIYPHKIFQL
jgi:hypothetical protein